MNIKPTYLLIGGFALWYLIPAFALKKLQFKLSGFKLVDFSDNHIDFSLLLSINNPSSINLTLNSLQAQVFLNGDHVSDLNYSGGLALPAKGTNSTILNIHLNRSKLAQTLWDNIILNNFRNSNILISGKAYINGKLYPFNMNFNLNQ